MLNQYLSTGQKHTCYGCGACEKQCPVGAITMGTDEEGFYYPVLDEGKCVQCGSCEVACPVSIENWHPKNKSFYIMQHKDKDVLVKSQTAGFFTAISDVILQEGGSVYGTILDDTFTAVEARATTAEERDAMCRSKYVQSKFPKEIWQALETDVKSGKPVLFAGTPCQAGAVWANYGEYDNLIVTEFLCHGVPTPKLWKDYLASYKQPIEKAVFRPNLQYNRLNHAEVITTIDGCEHISTDYAYFFIKGGVLRPSCYSCQFAKEERMSDLTFGGYLEKDASSEIFPGKKAMVFVHTEKGKALQEKAKDAMHFVEKEVIYFRQQPNYYHPWERPKERDALMKDYLTHGYEFIRNTYATDEEKQKRGLSKIDREKS